MKLLSLNRAAVNPITNGRSIHAEHAVIRRGFTLIELLVVMAIISILLSILLPAMGHVRQLARITDTRQEISRLQGAIEHYYHDWNSYPGPINTDIIVGIRASSTDPLWPTGIQGNVTQAENLVLGLCGGITPTITGGTGPSATMTLALNLGNCYGANGPFNLNPYNNQQYPGYINLSPHELTNADASGNGFYADARGTKANDSNIPEFIDHFDVDGVGVGQTSGSPILYMRARGGATGCVSDGSTGTSYQYDVREVLPYTANPIGIDRITITPQHGLQKVGTGTTLQTTDANGNNIANDALPYLLANEQDPSNPNATGTPRESQGYILISAGLDRVYGTIDDICNFGSLHP